MTLISILREPDALDLPLPAYATDGAAGMDLRAQVMEPIVLRPGERQLIFTGIRIALPEGFEAQVRPRSGLALKHGIGMVNSPGTIDSDYRGVIGVILINWGGEEFVIARGDRIAQLIIGSVARAEWREVDELPGTVRHEGGFGHTGARD